jgi:anti-anti-sigma factor
MNIARSTTTRQVWQRTAVPAGLGLARRLTAAGEAMITVRGELDIATADSAVQYVTGTIDRYRAPIVLNLAGLEFCDARGLGALVAMRRHADEAGVSLWLCAPRRLLVRMIQLTGLAGRLPIRAARCPAAGPVQLRSAAHRPAGRTGRAPASAGRAAAPGADAPRSAGPSRW